jgi:hypothetical protein
LNRNEIIDLFDGKENFISFHNDRFEEKIELENYCLE